MTEEMGEGFLIGTRNLNWACSAAVTWNGRLVSGLTPLPGQFLLLSKS